MDDFALLNATIFEADPLPVLLSMLDDDLVPLNGQEPDQQADETTGAGGDPQDVDNPVEEIYVPWVGDLPDIIDNDHSYSAYEPETSSSLSPQEPVDPFSGQIRISCMDDLRYLAAAGEPVFGEVIDDIDMEGWAAGFDDMFKFLKLGERFVFDTPEAFEAFCVFSPFELHSLALLSDIAHLLSWPGPLFCLNCA